MSESNTDPENAAKETTPEEGVEKSKLDQFIMSIANLQTTVDQPVSSVRELNGFYGSHEDENAEQENPDFSTVPFQDDVHLSQSLQDEQVKQHCSAKGKKPSTKLGQLSKASPSFAHKGQAEVSGNPLKGPATFAFTTTPAELSKKPASALLKLNTTASKYQASRSLSPQQGLSKRQNVASSLFENDADGLYLDHDDQESKHGDEDNPKEGDGDPEREKEDKELDKLLQNRL